MKKLVSLFLAVAMTLVCCAALAEEVPEGYPEIRPDIDFGGATIEILDYWSGDEGSDARKDNPTEDEQKLYDYRDWLMKTYNCHIVQKQGGGWDDNVAKFMEFAATPFDGTYRLYIIEPGSVARAIKNNYCRAWDDLVDLTDEKWNPFDLAFTTKNGKAYGVYAGAVEPRQCLYFNKRVLEEAGIEWEEIYDMQEAGTWTWDVLVEMCEKLTRDIDGDGINDYYGLVGDNTDFYLMSVFSNGGTFFEKDEAGKLHVTVDSQYAIDGLNWGKETWAKYACPQPADTQWDWYKTTWKEGFCGFYMYQTYGGFNDDSEMADMADKWGCVAFPKGPNGDTYVHVESDNITVMPDKYSDEDAAKLAFIYDMWTNHTPGVEDDWVGNKLNYTDDRAVYETYAMLREPDHTIFNMMYTLGRTNDILGPYLLWNLSWDTPASQIEQNMNVWTGLCDEYNADPQ